MRAHPDVLAGMNQSDRQQWVESERIRRNHIAAIRAQLVPGVRVAVDIGYKVYAEVIEAPLEGSEFVRVVWDGEGEPDQTPIEWLEVV